MTKKVPISDSGIAISGTIDRAEAAEEQEDDHASRSAAPRTSVLMTSWIELLMNLVAS